MAYTSPVSGQRVRFGALGLDDGLTNTNAISIIQDADGFLWVGTQTGLHRYDGRSFRVDWTNDNEPSPVAYGRVRALLTDDDGTLWAGTDIYGLFRFDGALERFDAVPFVDSTGAPRSPPERIWDLAAADDSLVFLATSEGLAHVQWVNGAARVASPGDVPWIDGCATTTRALWVAPGGSVWVGTEDGCLQLVTRTGHDLGARLLDRFRSPVADIAAGPGDTVWVALDGEGLFAFANAGGRLGPVSLPPAPDEANGRRVRQALTDRDGVTWVGTRAGLVELPGGGRPPRRYTMESPELGDLPHEFIYSLYEDRQGVLWIGTWNGLARLTPFRTALRYVPRPVEPGGEDLGGIVAIRRLDAERLILGTLGGHLLELGPNGVAVPLSSPREPLDMADVFSLAVEPDGDIWVATAGSGVERYSQGSWRSYRRASVGAGGIPDDNVASIAIDHAGAVWAGTMARGLSVYDSALDRFVPFTGPDDDFEFLASYVWPILEDSSGALWFGANGADGRGGGVQRLSPDRTELSAFETGGDGSHPNGGRVLTIALAGDSLVWIGTQGGGLGRLDVATGTVRFYTTEEGLPDNNVFGVVADDRGNVWATTNRGIVRFDPLMEAFWVFREDAGAQGRQFYANAAYRVGGLVYLGGVNGLNVVDPAQLTPRRLPPPVVLTGLSIRGSHRPGIHDATAKAGLMLEPDENFFTFQFAALDFTDVTQNRYRYRLEPLEPDWVDAGAATTATYTSVPPGTYTFRTIARNSEGVWNREGLAIPIVVRPPFYRTWWFQAAVVALVAAVVTAVYNYRVRQELRLQRIRLQIAGRLHDDIGANLSAIALKSEMIRARLSPDDPQSARLAEVTRIARDTTHAVRETVWVVNTRYDTLRDLVARLQDTAATLLEGAVSHEFRLHGEVPPVPVAMEVRQHLFLLVKEAIHNVQKHAAARTVEIHVSYDRPRLRIEVRDDGKGFVPEAVTEGSGLGLMRRRAEEVGADLLFDSGPGQGTTVSIDLKVR